MMTRDCKSRPILRASLVLAVGLLSAAGLMLASTPALAITFDLTSDHCTTAGGASGGGCGNQTSFGTVTLAQSGPNVSFDVVLLNGNRFVETSAADQQLF